MSSSHAPRVRSHHRNDLRASVDCKLHGEMADTSRRTADRDPSAQTCTGQAGCVKGSQYRHRQPCCGKTVDDLGNDREIAPAHDAMLCPAARHAPRGHAGSDRWTMAVAARLRHRAVRIPADNLVTPPGEVTLAAIDRDQLDVHEDIVGRLAERGRHGGELEPALRGNDASHETSPAITLID